MAIWSTCTVCERGTWHAALVSEYKINDQYPEAQTRAQTVLADVAGDVALCIDCYIAAQEVYQVLDAGAVVQFVNLFGAVNRAAHDDAVSVKGWRRNPDHLAWNRWRRMFLAAREAMPAQGEQGQ